MFWIRPALALVLAVALSLPLQAEELIGDSERGAQLFRSKCFACHSLQTDRVGPGLGGVVGRKAGTRPGFAYSPALASANFTWDGRALDSWLAKPAAFLPGSRMPFALRQQQDRLDVIAYLASSTEKP